MNKPILIGIFLFLIAFASFLFVLKRKSQEPAPVVPQKTAAQAGKTEEPPVEQRRINVKLFFNDSNSSLLAVEDRSIIYEENLHVQINEVLKELIKGPEGNLGATIPGGTQLHDIFITKEGNAYVDFSPELSAGHVGGSKAEINTIYSIVNTLTLNFPQIKGVQILIDDRAVETLTGHIDLSRPLRQDLSIVQTKMKPQPLATQTAETEKS